MFSLFGAIGIDGIEKVLSGLASVDKAGKGLEKTLNKMGQTIYEEGVSLSETFTAPIMALGVGMVALANKTGDYAEELLKLKDITGLSTNNLQIYKNIARQTGVEFTGLVGSITKFTGKLGGIIDEGGNAFEAIKKLGINVKDSTGHIRNMNDVFPELIKALQNVKNPTERNALAVQIFGKSLKDIAPVIALTNKEFDKLTQEAKNSSTILSEESLEAAHNFQIQLENLKETFAGVWRKIAIEFIPILRDDLLPIVNILVPAFLKFADAIKGLSNWFRSFSPAMRQLIIEFAVVLAIVGPLYIMVSKLIIGTGLLKTAVRLLTGAMVVNPFTMWAVAIAAVTTAIVALNKQYWEWIDTIQNNETSNKQSEVILKRSIAINKEIKAWEHLIDVENLWKSQGKKEYNASAITKAEEKIKGLKQQLIDLDNLQNPNKKTKTGSSGKDVSTATKDELKDIEDLRKARQKMVQDYKDQMSEMSDSEELRLEKSRVAAIADAMAIGMSQEGIQSIEELYAQKKINLANKVLAEKKKTYQEEGLAQNKRLDDEYNKERISDNEKLQLDLQTEKRLRQQKEDYFSDLEETRKTELKQENLSQKAIYNINKYYDNEIRKGKKKLALDFMNSLSSVISKIGQLFAMATQNQIDAIDNQTQIQTDAINSQLISQEEKDKKIAELNKKADEEKKALQLEEFKRQKVIAIISAIIGTAVAVVNALASGGIAMAVIVGVLGAIEIALIASQPDPMAEGGLVMSNPGPGHVARIGEGSENELVLPMKTGVNMLANNLIEKMSSINPFNNGNGFLGLGGNNTTNNSTGGNVNNNFNIGTLIGDERSFKELTRKIIPILKSENQRKALVTA